MFDEKQTLPSPYGEIKDKVRKRVADEVTDKFIDVLSKKISDLADEVAFNSALHQVAVELVEAQAELLDLQQEVHQEEIEELKSGFLEAKIMYLSTGYVPTIETLHVASGDFDRTKDRLDDIERQGFYVINWNLAQDGNGETELIVDYIANEPWVQDFVSCVEMG